MSERPPPICIGCTRLRGVLDAEAKCDAFPAGIPEAIIVNEVDHRKPVLGDGGLQFDPRNDAARRWAALIFPA